MNYMNAKKRKYRSVTRWGWRVLGVLAPHAGNTSPEHLRFFFHLSLSFITACIASNWPRRWDTGGTGGTLTLASDRLDRGNGLKTPFFSTWAFWACWASCLADFRKISSSFSFRGARRKPPILPLIISRLRSASSIYSLTRLFWFSMLSMRAWRAAARASFSSWISLLKRSISKLTFRSPFWRQKSGEFSFAFNCGQDRVAWSHTSQGHSPFGAVFSNRDKTRRWESCSSSSSSSELNSSSSASLALSTSSKRTNPGVALGSFGFALVVVFLSLICTFGFTCFLTTGLGSAAACLLCSFKFRRQSKTVAYDLEDYI